MNPDLPAFISDAVHIETTLPLDWRELSVNESTASEPADNLTTLQLIEAMDEPSHAGVSDAEKRNEDLQRLEQKMDMVLHLLGRLLAQQSQQALVTHPLVLGCHGMAWFDERALPIGRKIRLVLQIHPHVSPLVLIGESVATAQTSKYNCLLRFDAQGREFEAHFEKWIFRQHRRAVARKRVRPRA